MLKDVNAVAEKYWELQKKILKMTDEEKKQVSRKDWAYIRVFVQNPYTLSLMGNFENVYNSLIDELDFNRRELDRDSDRRNWSGYIENMQAATEALALLLKKD